MALQGDHLVVAAWRKCSDTSQFCLNAEVLPMWLDKSDKNIDDLDLYDLGPSIWVVDGWAFWLPSRWSNQVSDDVEVIVRTVSYFSRSYDHYCWVKFIRCLTVSMRIFISQGERGPQGFPGPQGEEGCPGMRGPKVSVTLSCGILPPISVSSLEFEKNLNLST